MITEKEKIVNKFKLLSEKYHKMSLLFYELSQSLNIELKPIERNRKEIKKYLKENLNLNYDKIILLSKDINNLSFKDLKGGKENAN